MNFDITKPDGRENALTKLRELNKNVWIHMLIPQVTIGIAILEGVKSLTSDPVEKETAEQKKAAIEIIRAGKECGVDELEITMSEKAGLSLGSSIEGFPLEFLAGASGNMTLKVKYK